MWPNLQETADLLTFTEEILNGKLHFLCSDNYSWITDIRNKWFIYIIYTYFLNRKKVTHITLMLHQYRNQSIDLHCKSIGWFLNEGNIGMIWVRKSFNKRFRKKNLENLNSLKVHSWTWDKFWKLKAL